MNAVATISPADVAVVRAFLRRHGEHGRPRPTEITFAYAAGYRLAQAIDVPRPTTRQHLADLIAGCR